MADVFISYKTEDRALAETLAKALEAHELEVWWDRDLIGGDEFRGKIQGELKKSDAVIVIWTKGAVESRWVMDEADEAANHGKLLPVRFAFDFDIPLGFRQIQAHDLSAWKGDAADPRLRDLLKKLEEIRNQRFATLALAFKGRMGEKIAEQTNTVRLGAALFTSAANLSVLGLPMHRFIVGGLVMGAVLGLLLYYVSSMMPGPLLAAAIALPFSYVARALHQFVIIGKGLSSRRFFDGGFRFWLWISALLAVIASVLFVYRNDLGVVLRDFPFRFIQVLGAIVLARSVLGVFNAPVRKGGRRAA